MIARAPRLCRGGVQRGAIQRHGGMFDSFRKFLSEASEGGEHPIRFEHDDYRLAAAALLVHAAAIDGDISDAGRDQLHAGLKRQSGLGAATTAASVADAPAAAP